MSRLASDQVSTSNTAPLHYIISFKLIVKFWLLNDYRF
jgi:hypothetical protein